MRPFVKDLARHAIHRKETLNAQFLRCNVLRCPVIHTIADARGRLLSILLTDGATQDCPVADPLIAKRKVARRLLGDKRTTARRSDVGAVSAAPNTCGTIRTKLLNIGALVTVRVRRVRVAMTPARPWRTEFAAAHQALQRSVR